MTAAIASVFRSLNAQLLYRRGLVTYFLKVPYAASVYFFKSWVKKKRQPTITTISNFDRDLKIQVDLSRTMGASLYWTGFHEFNEMRFLNRYLRADMTFIDAGANQGEFSLFASKRLSKGKVLAFEPMSAFFDRLVSNIALNDMNNVQCYRLGLSDHEGEVPIYFNEDNALNHEGLASLFPLRQKDEKKEVITLVLLDEIVVRESVEKVDFIKIDVEGSEWAVLKGSQRILKKDKPALMVELNDETALMAGYQVDDMIAWLRNFSYRPYVIVRNGLVPLKTRPAFCNAVFLAQ